MNGKLFIQTLQILYPFITYVNIKKNVDKKFIQI